MKSPEKKSINAVFIIAFLILFLINVLTYLNTRTHFVDEKIVKDALLATQIDESFFSAITEAETSRRGYYITNNVDFLLQHNVSVNRADSILLIIKNKVNKTERQKIIIDSINVLISARKKDWEESIEIQELRKKDLSTQISYTTKGKEVLDRIRAFIYEFQEQEGKIIGERLEKADKSAANSITTQIIGSVIAYIFLITGLIFLNRNITKRKEVEQSLWESRNWFATTLHSIGDGVIVTSRVNDVVYMNKVAENLTGWKEDEAKGLLLDHIFSLVDEATGKKPEAKSRKDFGRVSLKTKSNLFIPIEYTATELLQDDNRSLGMVYIFRDVSESRKAEEELLESKKFIQRIADSIPSVIYIYTLNGLKLTYVNYKVLDMLGYSSEYIMKIGGEFFEKFIHPDDMKRLRNMSQRLFNVKDSEIIDYEYRIVNSKGEWKTFRSYDVVFSRNESGSVLEILGTAMDVTEKVKMAEEIKRYSGHLEELVDVRTKELQSTNDKLKKEIEERVRAEKSIIEAEEKFRSLVENSLVGIYIIQDGLYVYVNPRFEDMFGFGLGELNGMNSFERVHPDYLNLVRDNINKRLNNEIESNQYIFKGIKKDGSFIDVEVRGTKMFYKGKMSIIGSMLDITERLRTEEEIKHSRQKLLFHIHQTPLCVIEWDTDFRVVEWNPAAEKIFGYTKDEVIGKHSSFIVPEYIRPDINQVWQQLLRREGGTRSTNENIRKDGRIILCEWYNTPLLDDKGYVIGVASLIQDITERKHFEQAIIDQQQFLKKVIDTNPNFIFAKDWEGRFTLVNKSVADNYGTTVDMLIGKSDADFNPNKEEIEHFLSDDREVIAGKISKFIAEEVVYNSGTGESKWYQTIKVPLVTKEGEVQVLGVATDITARRMAEEITKRSLHEKELLLKEIHHRVKNNLQIIVSLLKLQSKYIHDDRDLVLFNNSRSRVETMSMIHEKLYKTKDLANIDLGNYINDLSHNIINSQIKNPSELSLYFNSDSVLLGIDTAIPCGLIMNELLLCIINRSINEKDEKELRIDIRKIDDEIAIIVKDNGKGINTALDVYSPDSLGLQLIDMLVKQIDGTVSIRYDSGTLFEMKFKEITYKERI